MTVIADIQAALLARCQSITTANGYNTDIGLAASVATPNINPDDLTDRGLVVITETGDENIDDEDYSGDGYVDRVDWHVVGHMPINDGNAVTMAGEIMEDIKTAVLDLTDRTIGDICLDLRYVSRETQYPEAAGNIVSVTVNVYTIHMEIYGTP